MILVMMGHADMRFQRKCGGGLGSRAFGRLSFLDTDWLDLTLAKQLLLDTFTGTSAGVGRRPFLLWAPGGRLPSKAGSEAQRHCGFDSL